jgi:hypothetical protein
MAGRLYDPEHGLVLAIGGHVEADEIHALGDGTGREKRADLGDGDPAGARDGKAVDAAGDRGKRDDRTAMPGGQRERVAVAWGPRCGSPTPPAADNRA